jgi:hypothetical protein
MPDLYEGEIFEDSGSGELVDCFEHGRIRPGLGFNDIEEVARMDESVEFLLDDLIYRFEKIDIDPVLVEVSSRPRD